TRRAPKFAALARNQCTVCHEVASATREGRPKPYAETCAGCHDAQIQKAELVLFDPERVTNPASLLLGLEEDGHEPQPSRRFAKLWPAVARSEPAPLVDGLDAGTVRGAMAAWSAKRPLPEGEAPESPGWHAGANRDGNPSLFYRPRGHADALARAWIEHA